MKIRLATTAVLIILAIMADPSSGQAPYPTKPIQVFVGMAPGGSVDVLVRALGYEAKKYLGQELVIVNKPGSGGVVSAVQVAVAKPDGYTLGATPSSTFTVTPFIQDVKIDLIKESSPILSFSRFDVVAFVKADSPINTFKDFIEFARANPGKATYGTPGVGTKAHLAFTAIAAQEGVRMTHVPFAGDAPAVNAVLGGHIVLGAGSPAGPISHVQAGTLKLIAVVGDERMEFFPSVPTTVELGYPYPLPVFHLLHGPKGVPDAIIRKLEDAFEKASQSSVFKDLATKNLLYSKKHLFGAELSTFLLNERTKTGELIQKLGLMKK
jgi:tripartite-type tricarboxylate transporter receptor subunit TctC